MTEVLLLVGSSIVVFAADRCAKCWAVARARAGRRIAYRFVSLRPVFARDRLETRDGRAHVALWVFVALFALALVSRLVQGPLVPVALGLALGGAASNLADRLRSGMVVDHVHLGFGRRFNVADAGIVVGTLVGALGVARAAVAA